MIKFNDFILKFSRIQVVKFRSIFKVIPYQTVNKNEY